jgi:hypothetical protein
VRHPDLVNRDFTAPGPDNHQRLHSALADVPPAEHEALHEFRYAGVSH